MTQVETSQERRLREMQEAEFAQLDRRRSLSRVLGWIFYPLFVSGAFWWFGEFAAKTASNGICFAITVGVVIFLAMQAGAWMRGEK